MPDKDDDLLIEVEKWTTGHGYGLHEVTLNANEIAKVMVSNSDCFTYELLE